MLQMVIITDGCVLIVFLISNKVNNSSVFICFLIVQKKKSTDVKLPAAFFI